MNVITNVNWGKKEEPREPMFCEPEFIPCIFITGARAKVESDVVTFVGWTLVEEEEPERRIQVRFSMPRSAAIDLSKLLGDQLA